MADKFVKTNPFEAAERREKVPPKKMEEIPTPPADPTPEPEQVEKQESTTEVLSVLADKKPAGKGCNVYLDLDVISKLDKLAKQNKSTRSKVLNTLLRSWLLGE